MKNRILVFSALATLAAASAQAQLVYDNGPINGTIEAYTINFTWQVSDSFTVASDTSLASAQIGTWQSPSDTMTGVSWEIGTTPFGNDISSGTASVTDTPTGALGFGYYPIAEDTFSISGSVDAGTTYYFTLYDATTAEANPVYWDENDGPSTAVQNNGTGSIGSESFQLYSSVPDGGMTAMLLTGGLSVLAFIKRKVS